MFFQAYRFLIRRIIPRRLIFLLLENTFAALAINPIFYIYNRMGILNYKSMSESGEDFFLNSVCKPYLKGADKPVIFDVGANTGNYSLLVNSLFPNAKIYSFEPLNVAFKEARKKLSSSENIYLYNLGIGSMKDKKSIYTYKDQLDSEHASIHKGVFEVFHKSENLIEQEIEIDTLDNLCKQLKIDKVHFLKIDTEGFELEVLKGANKLLREGKIDIIQFEFNEMNVISRVFLKDFYDLLSGFKFYRLNSSNLIPLGEYNSLNEIFKFQNIVAINNDINIFV